MIKERNQIAKIAHIGEGKYQSKRTVVTLMQRKLMLHTSDLTRRQSVCESQSKKYTRKALLCGSRIL